MIFQLSGASLASKAQLMDIEYFLSMQIQVHTMSWSTQALDMASLDTGNICHCIVTSLVYPMARWDGGSFLVHHCEYFSSTCWKSLGGWANISPPVGSSLGCSHLFHNCLQILTWIPQLSSLAQKGNVSSSRFPGIRSTWYLSMGLIIFQRLVLIFWYDPHLFVRH